jgi:hypothetical protein
VLEFVKTGVFEAVLNAVNGSLNVDAYAVRDLFFPVVSGAMGSGKSRLTSEVCMAVERLDANRRVIAGYLPRATDLQHSGRNLLISADCLHVLADVLVKTLFRSPPAGLVATVPELKERLESENYGGVVLHIDEYAGNIPGVDLLLRGCAIAWHDHQLHVVPILTGLMPLARLSPPADGSRFNLNFYVAEPLAGTAKVRALVEEALASFINVPVALVRNCAPLCNLLTDCGGYPASLQRLANELISPGRRTVLEHLRATGNLTRDEAQSLYSTILAHLSARYDEPRWVSAFGTKEGDSHLSVNTRKLLSRLVLLAVTETRVFSKNQVVPERDVSFLLVEQAGFITLKPKDPGSGRDGLHTVVIPQLALCVMNDLVKEIAGDVLKNPFEVKFEIVEKLAMSSLHARLRALRVDRGPGVATCALQELRPGALLLGPNPDRLVITLPDQSSFHMVGALLGTTTDVRTGEGGIGPLAPWVDGTCVLAAPNEQGVDGAAILSGTLDGVAVDVLFLSQAKSKSHPNSSAPLQTAEAQTILDGMAKAEDRVCRSWLKDRPKRQRVVVFDVFSDRDEGPRLAKSNFTLPGEGLVVITTGARLEACIGSVLSVRSRLKRVAEGEEVKKKQRGGLKTQVGL